MKRLAIAGGALVTLGVLLYVIGLLLPSGHVATLRADYAAPPDSVWAVITDPLSFPTWRADVTRAEPRDDGGWVEHYADGSRIPFAVEDIEPGVRLVTRIDDERLPFGGTWTYELIVAGNATSLQITERGKVRNPIFRIVSKFMDMSATMRRYMTELGARFGEEVAPVP